LFVCKACENFNRRLIINKPALKKLIKGIKSYDFLIFSFKFNSAAAEVCLLRFLLAFSDFRLGFTNKARTQLALCASFKQLALS